MKLKYAWFLLLVLALGSAYAGQGKCSNFFLWDAKELQELSLTEALPDLKNARLIIVGETHDNAVHHQAQLSLIKVLHDCGTDLAVGLEMFKHKNQTALNRWIQGEMEEAEFRKVFQENWSESWPLYRDIFIYCRNNSIAMRGLNVPREMVRQVSNQGFNSLSPEQKEELPMSGCDVQQEYKEFLKRVQESHHHKGKFEYFCQAQLVWDTAMAHYAMSYLSRRPEKLMVLLCGSIHARKQGVYTQVLEKDPDFSVVSIIPCLETDIAKSSLSHKDCDYLLCKEE